MMMTISLAARNLMRNRRRSIATLVAIAIGSVTILLFGGYKNNIKYMMQTVYVRTVGHLQIQHQDFYLYGSGNPNLYTINNYQSIIDKIRSDSVLANIVNVVTPTLQFGGIAGNYSAGVSRTVLGSGLVPTEQSQLREWNLYKVPIVSSPHQLNGTAPNSAVIGIGLARVLKLCEPLRVSDCPKPKEEAAVGGKALAPDIAQLGAIEARQTSSLNAAESVRTRQAIELLASTARGTPNVAELNVLGAENQNFKELDEVYIATHLQQAQRLVFGNASPKVTAILIQLHDTDQLHVAQERLRSMLDTWSGRQPLAVRDFISLNTFYAQSEQMFDTMFGFISLLIGGIVLFTVGNTMNTAVVERTIEIGTLRAIGLRRSGIRRLIVMEGAMLGTTGALSGVLVAIVSAALINSLEIMWLLPAASKPLPLAVSLWGENKLIGITTISLICVATLSAWWPAYRAARLSVVEALRHT